MPTTTTPKGSIRAIRIKGDRIMTAICWALWLISLGFATLFGTWLVWAVCATSLALIASALTFFVPGTRGSRIGIGLVFMGFSALTIHQSHGVIETHFGIFALLAFLLYYRDWRPIFCSAIVICLHHLIFCWLQMNGYPVFIFQHSHHMTMVFVHAAYVIFEAAMLIYLAQIIRIEAIESSAISQFGERIASTGIIDLSFDSTRHRGAAARGLTSLIHAIQSFTQQSGALATRVTHISEDISTASTRIIDLSKTQAQKADGVSSSVQIMSKATAQINSDCAAVAQVASGCGTIIAQGCDTIQQTAKLMLTVSEAAGCTVAEIRHLADESARIQSIVGIMNDIASQSGLLALNASIEAARAGDKGKGFQVVALEIRTLSDRAHSSLTEVQSIVDTIASRVAHLQDYANRCQNAAALGGDQVKATHEALASVALQMPNVTDRVGRVMETADQHALISTSVLSGISAIGDSIQHSAAEMNSFANLSHALVQMSAELSNNVSHFHQPQPNPHSAA